MCRTSRGQNRAERLSVLQSQSKRVLSLLPPPVTRSDEEPIAAGGRQTLRVKYKLIGMLTATIHRRP